MKRRSTGRGGGDGTGYKRQRSDPFNDALAEGNFELRVLIPSKSAGAIIGKGGEYINAVSKKFDAYLDVPDSGTPERVLTMTVSLGQIKDCFTEILNKLAEKQQDREDLDIRVIVNQNHAGAIIGRGGSKIKELQDQTKSKITVYKTCCPGSTDRVVQINTDQTNMPEVVQAIIDFISDIPIKGEQCQYDASYYDPHMALDYGGYSFDYSERFHGGTIPSTGGNDELEEGKYQLRLLIPTKSAGVIIGKGGETIKSISHKFEATIDVRDRGTPERVFNMTVALDRIKDCFAEILDKLAERQQRENRNDLDIRMIVNENHAGAIIGRGGSKIKELQDQTKSSITVYKTCCPGSTDRVVQITTGQSNMPEVVQAIIDFIREIPIKGVQRPYDASFYDPHIALEYGGFVDRSYGGPPAPMGVPYGGGYGDYGPPSRGGRGGPGALGRGGYGGFSDFGGYIPGRSDRLRIPPPPMGRRGGYGPPGRGGRGGSGAPGRGGYYGNGGYGGPLDIPSYGGDYNDGADDSETQTTQVTIPNDMSGTFIGNGGECILRIRQESGAKIDVGQPYGNERVVYITGTPDQIQHAQHMLVQTVRYSSYT